MPSEARSSQVAGSAKKQQTISSFFTKSMTSKASSTTNSQLNVTFDSHQDELVPSIEGQNSQVLLSDDEDDVPLTRRPRTTKKRALQSSEEPDEHGSGSPQTELSNRKRTRVSANSVSGDGPEVTAIEQDDYPVQQPDNTLQPIAANGATRLQVSERTSKYIFSSSPAGHEEIPDDDEIRKRKERLHQKFVKKLGHPDSIAGIKRRHWQVNGDTEATDDIENPDGDDGDAQERDEPPARGSKKKGSTDKSSKPKLTPLEKQFLEIKRQHPDVLLVVEVGYKFKFFGEDARTAAKELHIVCIPGKFRYDEHSSEAHLDRFASASIPVHRLHVHVRRLVAAGQKVGVVRQLETAALKAIGDNRNTPFVRKLTNLYTKGTYIDDVDDLGESVANPSLTTPATGYLLCITENVPKVLGSDEKVRVGIVAVQPATGDVIYDEFEDGFMRSEIETRILHIAPCELLIVGTLSKATEKLVQHLSGNKSNVFGDRIRVERVERQKTMAATAYSHVSNFYADKMKVTSNEQDEKASTLYDNVLKLPENVTICLSAMITHLTDYGLEHVFDLTKYFQSFSARSHMLLNGTTLTSLEIYQNQSDHSENGSLFWTLNRTMTRFGKRLLRKWVGRPLLEKARLESRIHAVEELKNGERTVPVDKIKHLMRNIKIDLEKSLIRIYYGKCTRPELLTVLQTLQRISTEFNTTSFPASVGFQSALILDALSSLPNIADDVTAFLEKINAQAAQDDDKYEFFRETEETDTIQEHKYGIAGVEHDLDQHRSVAAEKIRKKKVDYVTVAGIEYLIEIDNSQIKHVPASWAKISGTKKVSRFHTPEVVKLIKERDQHKEALAAACDSAFSQLLVDISAKYQSFRDSVQALATLDCLLSLASVASQPGYVKPEYVDDVCIEVENGRHPMVEKLLLDSFVPNNIDLATNRTRALLITGPNMGGKSSYVRQVALIAIMGQIGSYVPAESARLGLLDAVFTRMGAFDNMLSGESTFMVELSETADILKQASSRSLIILDELGRGTSTHDGVAIAQAVLDHVVRDTKSLTLFITHYQNLSSVAQSFEKGELRNVHMKFAESGNNGRDITFLYDIGEGVAHRSYGLNVARLAGIPEGVLETAATKSHELEDEAHHKKLLNSIKSLSRALVTHDGSLLDSLVEDIEQL